MQRQESVSDSEEEDRALVEKTKEKEKKREKNPRVWDQALWKRQ